MFINVQSDFDFFPRISNRYSACCNLYNDSTDFSCSFPFHHIYLRQTSYFYFPFISRYICLTDSPLLTVAMNSDEDSQMSSSNRFGVKVVKAKPTQKKIDKSKLKIKMLVDIAKMDTDLKDNFEKEFVDVSDNSDLFTEKHAYFAVKCAVPGLFRWTFMSTNELIECRTVPVDIVDNFALVLLSCDEFLKLLMKSEDGIDFDDLGNHITNIKTSIIDNQLCPVNSSLIVVLMDLDKHLLKLQKKVQFI